MHYAMTSQLRRSWGVKSFILIIVVKITWAVFYYFAVSFVDDCSDLKSNATTLTEPSGYLALFPRTSPSLPRDRSADGTVITPRTCPWLIGTEPGRKINVSWQVASPSGAASSGAVGGLNQAAVDNHHMQSPQQQQLDGEDQRANGIRQSCGLTLSFTEPGIVGHSPVRVTCNEHRTSMPTVYVSKSNRIRIDVTELELKPFHFTTTAPPDNGHMHDVADYIQQQDAWRPYILHYRGMETIIQDPQNRIVHRPGCTLQAPASAEACSQTGAQTIQFFYDGTNDLPVAYYSRKFVKQCLLSTNTSMNT